MRAHEVIYASIAHNQDDVLAQKSQYARVVPAGNGEGCDDNHIHIRLVNYRRLVVAYCQSLAARLRVTTPVHTLALLARYRELLRITAPASLLRLLVSSHTHMSAALTAG